MIKEFFVPNKKNRYKPYLLRKVALTIFSILLILVNSFGGIFGIDQAQASTITPTNIINLTNQERSAAGLNKLKANSKLSSAALAKANNMFEEQYWDHFGPNGETPWQFIRGAGYYYVYAGENLAKGFSTAEGVHEAWMASTSHRANIMSGKYKDIGVAVVEGVLLGKRTTLVVQMFGNLTQDVAGATKTVTPTPKPSTNTEVGEIKSISITSPKGGSTIVDPSVDVKGSVKNITGEYSVSVYEGENLVGETESTTSTWEFDKDSDWSEGVHKVKAAVDDLKITSKEVSFTIDSTPPKIMEESIVVNEDNETFVLALEISPDWKDIQIVSGENTISLTNSGEEKIEITIPKESVSDGVVLMASDVNGNITQMDISEYFEEEEDKTLLQGLSLLSVDTSDGISIVIVSFMFMLLMIEIFVYWRKGRIREAAGDLFTVGVWWLVIAVAIFNGFTGIIY